MNCPNCGKLLQEGAKFCMGCGQRIPRCPTCGTVLLKRAKFCMVDGTPIPDEINALIPEPVQETVVVEEPKTETVIPEPVQETVVAEEPKTETVIPEPVQETVVAEEPKTETVIPEPVQATTVAERPKKETVLPEPVVEEILAPKETPVTEKPVEKPPVQKPVPAVVVPDVTPVKNIVKEKPKQKPAKSKRPAYDGQKMSAKKKYKDIIPLLVIIAIFALLAVGYLAGKTLFSGKEEPTAQQKMEEVSTEQAEAESSTTDTEPIETIPETEASPETEPPKILMPNCVGLTHEEAVLAFEAIPCQLSFDEVYHETAAANYIVAQNLPEGSELTAETVVLLTISKGPDVAPEGYNQKVTVTAAAGSSYGTLTLYDWENGQWVSKFACDASLGSNGISPDYGEGRKRTPEGVYKLGVALTAKELSNSGWPAHLVTSDTCVVDDVNSPLYNTIQSIQGLGGGVSYDPIGRTITQGTCNVCIYIEHNGNGYSSDNVVAGNGSVITICGRNPAIKPTFGCVDISATNMNNLLSMLAYEKNPHIEIYTE